MEKKTIRRYSRETKDLVVFSIVEGELFIEEAMVKYNITDRRTIVTWLRKYLREIKKEREREQKTNNNN